MPTLSAASALELLDLVSAPSSDPRPAPRTIAVFAHPDDEVIALGGRLCRHRETRFVCVTDGAPQDCVDSENHGFTTLEAYRKARADELRAALSLAGMPPRSLRQLGIPDQKAAFHLREIVSTLISLFREFQPEVLLTHPYEGGHPDHDACAFAVHSAAEAIANSSAETLPIIVEAAFYHAGINGIETARFLPGHEGAAEVLRPLNHEERRRREALLDCFPSQRDTLQYFRVGTERYRLAPIYDFSRPPHSGVLFYERHPWGLTGVQFCELARAATQKESLCD